jgi:hypothetical protein
MGRIRISKLDDRIQADLIDADYKGVYRDFAVDDMDTTEEFCIIVVRCAIMTMATCAVVVVTPSHLSGNYLACNSSSSSAIPTTINLHCTRNGCHIPGRWNYFVISVPCLCIGLSTILLISLPTRTALVIAVSYIDLITSAISVCFRN